MKTYSPKAGDIERAWHVLDAASVPLGRLAVHAATLLRGKHKPTFAPYLDMGDYVIVVNADKVRLSGSEEQKKYYRHSGYIGGLRERTFREMRRVHPTRVVEIAVKGMLPRNRLGAVLLHHLKVYAGPEHPHEAQLRAGTGARAQRRVQATHEVAPPTAAGPTKPAPPAKSAPAMGEAAAPKRRRAPRAAEQSETAAEKPKTARRPRTKAAFTGDEGSAT